MKSVSFRINTIREYLIQLDNYIKLMENDGYSYDFVFVFTDESYVNTYYYSENCYLPTDKI